jgi:hypothetical protein
LQFVLFTNVLHETAVALPNDGPIVLDAINRITMRVLLISFLVFLPLTLSVGVLFTFRIAGPVYRFEQFLQAVIRGEKPKDFRLRRGDKLTELAEMINVATRPLRQDEPAKSTTDGDSHEPPAPLASAPAQQTSSTAA